MDESREILMEKFFNNELNAEELLQFKKLLSEDDAFRQEVELHRGVIGGIEHYGEDLLRADIIAVQHEVKNELHDYKPPKGGNFFSQLLGWAVFIAVVGGVAYVLLGGGGEGGHKIRKKIKSEIEEIEGQKGGFQNTFRGDTVIRVETVYHTIKSKHIKPGDTVTIYSEEDLKKFQESQPTQAK